MRQVFNRGVTNNAGSSSDMYKIWNSKGTPGSGLVEKRQRQAETLGRYFDQELEVTLAGLAQ